MKTSDRPPQDRGLCARHPALVGAALIGLGAILALLMDERMLPRIPRTAGGIVGTGVVFLMWGALRVWSRQSSARRLWWGVGALVVVVGAAFATYSLGFYWKRTVDICGDSTWADTIEARAVGFHAYNCDRAQTDLARLRTGVCSRFLSPANPCRCGEDPWSAP